MKIAKILIVSRQPKKILFALVGLFLLNSCSIGQMDLISQNISTSQPIETIGTVTNNLVNASPQEVIVFCGNPGVGKSSLCNSIFQQSIFSSGVSVGIGVTQQKQEYFYENRKYIDTPGLADIQLRQQAAKEIENSLKENNNYKIIFVATLEAGKIREADLVTINTVCEAIKAPFEYGIVFNKVTQNVINRIGVNGENLSSYLASLIKQPASTIVIKKEFDMEDADNSYLSANSENRIKLLAFIADLHANMILDNQVQAIDISIYEERVREMETRLTDVLKQLSIQQKETERLTKLLEEKRQEEIKTQREAERLRQLEQQKQQEIQVQTQRLRQLEQQKQQEIQAQKKLYILSDSERNRKLELARKHLANHGSWLQVLSFTVLQEHKWEGVPHTEPMYVFNPFGEDKAKMAAYEESLEYKLKYCRACQLAYECIEKNK